MPELPDLMARWPEPGSYPADAARVMEDVDELRRIGDELQSEASRLAEWVLKLEKNDVGVPYEVRMARASTEIAVEEWTQERKKA